MHQEEIVKKIRNAREEVNSNSVSLANLLTTQIKTGFKESAYIFELLQNADDEAKSGDQVEVHFILEKNHLIIMHQGRPFEEKDILKICDVGSQDNEKAQDIKKTGYKGIGFKTVFNISDRVYIISGGYSIRFDKKYWEAKTTPGKPYPWQVIPIWTEKPDFPAHFPHEILAEKMQVITVIELDSARIKTISENLQETLENLELLLFLRNINTIRLRINVDKLFETVWQKKIIANKQQLFKNDQLEAEWLVYTIDLSIPTKIQSKLKEEDDTVCPPKLKDSQQVLLKFAYKIQKQYQLKHLKSTRLSAYLPTQMHTNLPFIVNTDFLLNVERTELLENAWNDFLIEKMAYYHVKTLTYIAKDENWRNNVLAVLSTTNIFTKWSNNKDFNDAFAKGLKEGLDKFAILPSMKNPDELLKIDECVIDEIKFWVTFQKYVTDPQYPLDKIVHPDLQNLEKIKKTHSFDYGYDDNIVAIKQVFDLEAFVDNVAEYAKKYLNTPGKNLKLIKFVLTLSDRLWRFKEKEYILASDNTIKSPNDLSVTENKEEIDSELLSFNSPHPAILKELSIESLKELDINILSKKAIAKQEFKENLKDVNFSKDEHIENIKRLFKRYQKNRLKGFDKIDGLKLINQKGEYINVKDCFFSGRYIGDPKLDEQIDAKDSLLSYRYVEENENPKEWVEFFEKLGVTSLLKIVYEETLSIYKAITILPEEEIEKYFYYLNQRFEIRKKGGTNDNDYLTNFIYIRLMSIERTEKNLLYILSFLCKHEREILQFYKEQKYVSAGNRIFENIPSYLNFYMRNTKFRAVDGKEYSIGSLYHPKFKPLKKYINVIDIDDDFLEPISDKFSDIIGFKKLTALDAFGILGEIKSKSAPEYIISVHEFIIIFLLNLPQDDLKEALSGLDKKNIKLLNTKSELTSINELSWSQQEEFQTLHRYPNIAYADICKFAQILEIQQSAENVEIMDACEDNEAKNLLNDRLIELALLESKADGRSSIKKYDTLKLQLEKLTIYKVEKLQIKNSQSARRLYYFLKNNALYVQGRIGKYKLTFCEKVKEYFNLHSSIKNLEHLLFTYKPENLRERREWLEDHNITEKSYEQLETSVNAQPTVSSTHKNEPVAVIQKNSTEKELKRKIETELPADSTTKFAKTAHPPIENVVTHTTSLKNFNVQVEPSGLNYEKVEYKKAPLPAPLHAFMPATVVQNKANLNPSSMKSPIKTDQLHTENTVLSRQAKIEVGRWGEESIYLWLKNQHYAKKSKYEDYEVVENPEGFIFKSKKDPENYIQVIWHNKNAENYASKDFTIIKSRNGIIKTRVVEVKSTESHTPHVADFSGNEVEEMLQQHNKDPKGYFILRLYNAGKADKVRIEKFKTPILHLLNGPLKAAGLQLKI